MRTIAPVTGRQFAWFRIIFGLYLAIHFAHLVPWGGELFSREGVLPAAALNPTYGILPNVLAVWDSAHFVRAFLVTLVGLSLLFCLGIWRRAAAVLLWYGWACLFNRNVLISNPSIPYVGLLLLLTALVPATEPLRAFSRDRSSGEFYVPGAAYWTAWALMALGYAFSGLAKLASPSWVDGTAIWHVLQNPLARDSSLRDVIVSMPPGVLPLMTWSALALELLFLPLAVWRRTRPVAWLAMAGMHVAVIAILNFADLSAGMLMLHLFTLDARWRGRHRFPSPRLTPILQNVRLMRMAGRKDRLPTLSGKEGLILDLLGRSKGMYGLELVSASGGELKRGTVYVTLARMEEKGFIASRRDDEPPPFGGLPRRLYAATSYGRELQATRAALRKRLVPRFAR